MAQLTIGDTATTLQEAAAKAKRKVHSSLKRSRL